MVKSKTKLYILSFLVISLLITFLAGMVLANNKKVLANEATQITEISFTDTLEMGEVTEQTWEYIYLSTTGNVTLTTEGVSVANIYCYWGGDNAAVMMGIIIRPNSGYTIGEDCTATNLSSSDISMESMVFDSKMTVGNIEIQAGDMFIYYEVGHALIYRNVVNEEEFLYYDFYKTGESATVKENPGDFRNEERKKIITKWVDTGDNEYTTGDEIEINEDVELTAVWAEGATAITSLSFTAEPTDYTIIEDKEECTISIQLDKQFVLAEDQNGVVIRQCFGFEMDGIVAFAVVHVPYGYYLTASTKIQGITEGLLYGPIYFDMYNVSLYGERMSNVNYGDYLIGSGLGQCVSYNSNTGDESSDEIFDGYFKKDEVITVRDYMFDSGKEGYYFAGWNAFGDGTGVEYFPGNTFTTGMFDKTLYAMWTNVELPSSGELSGNYYLSSDVTLTGDLNIGVGESVFINLNGHSINFSEGMKYIYNEGQLLIYDSTSGVNAYFNNTYLYREDSYTYRESGYTIVTGTTYPGQSLSVEAYSYADNTYLRSLTAYKSSDKDSTIEINNKNLTIPSYSFTVEAVYALSCEITEIPVITPSDYTKDEDGSISIVGQFSLDGDVDGIDVVEEKLITDNGICSTLVLRLSQGYSIDLANLEITGEKADRVTIVEINKVSFVELYKQMYGFTNIELGDYILTYQLGYTILYYDVDNELNMKAYTYKFNEYVIIYGNEFGFEKEGYYFAGWNTDRNGEGDYYIPGEEFSMDDENIILYPVWTNTPLPTSGVLDGAYVLLEDTILTEILSIEEGGFASINLHGHILDLNNTTCSIKCSGTLYIFDDIQDVEYYYTFNKNESWSYISNPTDSDKENSITYDKINDDTQSGTIIKVKGGSIVNGQNGAIYVDGYLFANNVNFIGNASEWYGGAIYCNGGSAFIRESKILGNFAVNGGGIEAYECYDCVLTDVVIMYNSATSGGGIYCISTCPTLCGSTMIINNFASQYGQNFEQEDWSYFSLYYTFSGEVQFFASELSTNFLGVAPTADCGEGFILVNDYSGEEFVIDIAYNEWYREYEIKVKIYYTITFVVSGSDVAPESQKIAQGGCPVDPEFTTTRKGFTFVGWSYVKDYFEQISFEQKMYYNIVAYAIYDLDYVQPTTENPEIVFNVVPDEQITYEWYFVTDGEGYYKLENETSSRLTGNYGVGSFVCIIYADGVYITKTEAITYSQFSIGVDEETKEVLVETTEGTNLSYKWYHWDIGEIYEVALEDCDSCNVYNMTFDETTKLWNCLGRVQYNSEVGFYGFFYRGEKVTITVNTSNAEFIDLCVYNGDYETFTEEVTGSCTFTYTITGMGYTYFEIYAYSGDYDEFFDYTASISLSLYDWSLGEVVNESESILSNLDDRIGYYYCQILVNNLPCCNVEVGFDDKINVQPSVDNDYTFDIDVDGEVLEYKWYEYGCFEGNVTQDSDFISTEVSVADYNVENNTWTVSEEVASNGYGTYNLFNINLNKGDELTLNFRTNENCYIRLFNEDYGFIYSSGEFISGDTFTYTASNSGNFGINVDAYTMDSDNNYYFHFIEVRVTIKRKSYTEVEGQTTDMLMATNDGTYVARAYTYRGYIESQPVEYCAHDYVNAQYTWNEDLTECFVIAKCSKCLHVYEEQATITTTISIERSVDSDEYTLITATFKNSAFPNQTKEIKTADKLMTFEIQILLEKDGDVISVKNIVENDNLSILFEDGAIPVKDGYTFAGWYYESEEGEILIEATDVVNYCIVIYAKWDKIDVSEFISIVESISDKQGEEKFNAIANALSIYNEYSEEEKQQAGDAYTTLKGYIEEYNNVAKIVNADQKSVTNIVLLVMAVSFGGIFALIYMLKGLLF